VFGFKIKQSAVHHVSQGFLHMHVSQNSMCRMHALFLMVSSRGDIRLDLILGSICRLLMCRSIEAGRLRSLPRMVSTVETLVDFVTQFSHATSSIHHLQGLNSDEFGSQPQHSRPASPKCASSYFLSVSHRMWGP
jgi:hypothetical protein